jgi:hypothetical protein
MCTLQKEDRMVKKKLSKIVRVCTRASTLIGVIALFPVLSIFPSCQSTTPVLVTLNCTDPTTSSLTANAEVNRLEAGPLSRRGFVYWEGTEGDPALNITVIPLVNPSFEDGDPPTGWTYSRGTFARSQVQTKSDSYSGSLTMNESESNAVVLQDIPNYSDYIGKTVVLGAWVYATEANQTRLCLADGGSSKFSSYHSGGGGWEFLTTPPLLVDAGATRLRLHFYTYSTTVAYIDGAVLMENAVFEDGDFGTGTYSLNITGLKASTSYVIRAFVENTAGISYGNNTVTCQTK